MSWERVLFTCIVILLMVLPGVVIALTAIRWRPKPRKTVAPLSSWKVLNRGEGGTDATISFQSGTHSESERV
jgi:hypothetical protein